MPVGQPLHADGAGVVGENFRQLILVGAARGYPAVAASVLEITGGSEGSIVRSDLVSVDLIGFGDGLGLTAEIVLGMAFVIVRVDVGVQNRIEQVLAAAALGKLILFGQVGNQVESKTGTLQINTIRTAGRRNVLGQLDVAFHHLILGFCQFIIPVQVIIGAVVGGVESFSLRLPVILKGGLFHIPTLVGVGGGNVVVVLITQITFGVALVVAIIGFGAVQCLALADIRPLVAVHIVGVLACIIGGQRRGGAGRLLGLGVDVGIGAGQLVSAILHRDDHAGAALHDVVLTEIEVREGQPAILDNRTGYQMVFGEHGQVVIHPLAGVVPDGGMPDRRAVGIGDFAVVHGAGHAIRVLDVLGSIQVIHRAVQPGIGMGLTAGHRVAVRVAAIHITHGIQIDLGQRDLSQHAVVLHDALHRGHGIAILVGGSAGVVGVVSTACILVLDLRCGFITRLVDGDSGLHPAGSQQLGSAGVAGGDVGTVMVVVQHDGAAVVGGGNLDVVSALAQRRSGSAGMFYIRPVAVIAGGGACFHDDELTLVPLGIVHRAAGVILGAIGGTVGNGVSSIRVAHNAVLVVPAIGDVLLRDGVPFIDLIQRVAGNLLAGLAINFDEVDLQGPFIVAHYILVGTVSRHSDGLVAAKTAIEFLEAIRNLHFIVGEADGCQFGAGSGDGCIHHSLGLGLQLRNGGVFGCLCRRICLALAAERPFLATQTGSAGLGHLVMHCPGGGSVTAVGLVLVILRVATGGHRLRTGRAHLPGAAVDAAARLAGRDRDGCTVHLFGSFQLLLVRIDSKRQIETAAG